MDLFSQTFSDTKTLVETIPGLQYFENYLTKQEHDTLIRTIDSQPWLDDLKRRVQHYGFKYDYKSRRINLAMRIGQLPDWTMVIAHKLYVAGYFKSLPDQLIINEYMPGQGITPHIDCEPCFEDTIVSISLGSNCVMDFTNSLSQEKISMLLAPRSIVVLQGESRYNWTHGIAPRKTDKYKGYNYQRGRRISLTFRKTIVDF